MFGQSPPSILDHRFSSFHYRYVVLLGLIVAILSLAPAFALNVPPLRARVNDLAGMLSPGSAQALEERLAGFERETGHQIAVLTVPSLEGDAIEDFGIRVADAWKIGQKGFDNGAILIIAQKERRLRIEVGYGLEGILPDAIANRIIQEEMVPRFRQSDYAAGIESGVDKLMQVTRGEKLPNFPASTTQFSEKNSLWVFLALLLVLSLPRLIMWRLVLPHSRAHGALIGGAAGVVLGGLASAASIITGVQVSLLGLTLLIALAIMNGIVSGLQGYRRALRNFGTHTDIRWNEPFYLGSDSYNMATLRQPSGVAGTVSGTPAGGGSSAGFSGGGGGFGGGGASGGW